MENNDTALNDTLETSRSEDMKAFAVAMYGLAEENGGTLTKIGLKTKWEVLKRYDIKIVTKAISYLIENRTKEFPLVPKTQEIIEAIEIVQNPELAIGTDHMAELQANEVLAFFHANGSAAAPNFTDPLTQMLMTTTWPYSSWGRNLTEKEKPFWKKDFIKAYRTYAESARTFSKLGISDRFTQIASQAVKRLPNMNPLQLTMPT